MAASCRADWAELALQMPLEASACRTVRRPTWKKGLHRELLQCSGVSLCTGQRRDGCLGGSVRCPTLDFGSGRDSRVVGLSPTSGSSLSVETA